jgi:starvation-inducible DNA-binding protein
MQAARNASIEQARQKSLTLLNHHLAAAVILQDRMRRSPRNLRGENFIMIDDMCNQVASLMETCTMLIADRLHDLGGTVRWPVLLDEVVSRQSVGHLIGGPPGSEPLDAFGQSVLDAVTMATAYGDKTTAAVMEQIWRGVDQQLWKADVHQDIRQ